MKLNTQNHRDIADAVLKGLNKNQEFNDEELEEILNYALDKVKEQKQIKIKAEHIADIATRMLNEQMTEEDCLFAINCYIRSIKLDVAPIESLDAVLRPSKAETKTKELSDIHNEDRIIRNFIDEILLKN